MYSIAIDGAAGSGKSTLARSLASRLGLIYVDTGSMYRAVAWAAMQRGLSLEDEDAMEDLAAHLALKLEADADSRPGFRALIEGRDVTAELYSAEVDQQVSRVAAQPRVRRHLTELQRRMGESGGVVMVGRDIGTVVLPDARFKVFLEAPPEARAGRRQGDLARGGQSLALDEVQRQLENRDRIDASRTVAPLTPAPGALHIDTGRYNAEECLALVLQHIEKQVSL